MKRAKHNLSHYRMLTANMGQLFPISCVPVLPGDTFQHHTTALVRVSPLNTPVMHPVSVRIHHFYVPNRIVWPEWEEFITGGNGIDPAPVIPTIISDANKKSMLSYLGVPPIAGTPVNELPLRCVNMIFNEYYRDQDLVTARVEDDNTEANIAWEKDYFTTARPWTQKGPQVSLPLGTSAPVHAPLGGTTEPTVFSDVAGADRRLFTPSPVPAWVQIDNQSASSGNELYADLTQATSANVNDVRAAFSLQRYQEARARYGSRFTEYLRYLGITPSDARLQRPEFLGGGSTRLNFSEVLQTTPAAQAGEAGVGDLFGHGIAGVRSNAYRKFFEEHGYVVSMMSIRPKSIYMNGVAREFVKRTKEDYYQKELVNLGQQEVYQKELSSENTWDVFGFQDRYHEYRSQPSQVSQDFRDTLNAWHMARDLPDTVTLNDDFVECDPTRRIFQITDTSVDTLWVMANHHIVARRLVPKRANPRIL